MDIIIQKKETQTLEESLEPFFKEFEDKAKEWAEKAMLIEVTHASQTLAMEDARAARLALRDVRLSVDKKHKELKEEALRTGQTLDAIKRRLVGLIEPIEASLLEKENFVKVQEEKRKRELYDARMAILKEIGYAEAMTLPLGEIAEDVFSNMVKGFKAAKAEKEEEERQARIKKEEEDKRHARLNDRIKRMSAAGLKWNEERQLFHWGMFAMNMEDVEADENRFTVTLNGISEGIKIEEKKASDLKAEQERKNKEAQDKLDKLNQEKRDKQNEERRLKRAPDKTKLLSLANDISLIKCAELKDEESQKILKNAMDLLAKVVKYIKTNADNL